MPQLNPAPWLSLLILAWGALLLYTAKTTKFSFHILPTSPIAQPHTAPRWPWPWA